MQSGSKGFGQGGVPGVHAFRYGDQHLREHFDIFGKPARQITDTRRASMNPAELLFAVAAIHAASAIGGTDTDFGPNAGSGGGSAFVHNNGADLVSQDVIFRNHAGGDKGMVGSTEARIGHFDQYFIVRQPVIRDLFINQSLGFTKNHSFH